MKMSLCNTFRLFVIGLIFVLSSIDTPTAFTLRRTTADSDLTPEESVVLEVKSDPQRRNDIDVANVTKAIDILDSTIVSSLKTVHNAQDKKHDQDVEIKQSSFMGIHSQAGEITTTIVTDILKDDIVITNRRTATASQKNVMSTPREALTTNNIIESTTQLTSDYDPDTVENKESYVTLDNSDSYFDEASKDFTTTSSEKSLESTTRLDEFVTKTSLETQQTLPAWKKYTTIERKRPPITKVNQKENVDIAKNNGEMAKAETLNRRVSLQDAITSDIPSLEQLKNDLLLSTLKQQAFVSESSLTVSSPATIQSTATDDVSTSSEKQTKGKWDTVETKRGGYLDFSDRTTIASKIDIKEVSGSARNGKGPLRAMFETGGLETDGVDDNKGKTAASQSQLKEDAIQEELLKEKLINENEENMKRHREENNDTFIQYLTEVDLTNTSPVPINNSNDDVLKVKPINVEKPKNTILYAVGPNYKPPKKIEVQPPKPFIRDPDDNSWRNESISSLGIVFKPKNSSKPFTQVLKNKTESEWNNLFERDSKNNVPDLRVRLEKMAEKRKSKRKKTDSLGNVIYFDYEENSSSAESSSTVKYENSSSSTVTISSPTTFESLNSTASSSQEPKEITTPQTATDKHIPLESDATKKPKKFFNVPEYYDSVDEEESDYLNMAKIDIKKFSVSPKTTPSSTTTTTSSPKTSTSPSTTLSWPIVNRKIVHSTTSVEPRTGTIQYFPPTTKTTAKPKTTTSTTTLKVNVNDYDDDFKVKVNSFTSTESPKNILPFSPAKSATPLPKFLTYSRLGLSDIAVTNRPEVTPTPYQTQPPPTTQVDLNLVSDDGGYNRGSYAIKHYRDFVDVAAKDAEYEKNMAYIPYTQAPVTSAGMTKPEVVTYETDKPKVNIEEYDYESQFRKDVLQRFVDNFNQNSERFKSDFPVLFNNSIIHRDTQSGREMASSRAFMRGLYNTDALSKAQRVSCEPNCENMTVELSPAYELHYYVPEQEEKEEAEPQSVTLPYPYRL